jgi:SWI/SNF-related matrix-associated actin-dependent regulator 1 of chromatin subfamily A
MNGFNKVFVITPNSLKYNYYNEIEKFTNSNAYIIGKKNKCNIDDAKYIIVNYEYFNSSDFNKVKNKFNKLNIGKIDCLISDECHRLKSSSSNTYKNFKKLFKDDIFKNGKISKVFMSGTPAPSKAAELYTVLHQISPLDFSTKKYFYEYYCGMNYNIDGYGWETNISRTKFEELFNKIAPFTYRKKKSEILKDLPEKTYQKIMLEMTSKEYEIYYDLEEGVANEFINKNLYNPLSIMGKLREYTSYLKVNNVKELIDSILECGEKFVAIDFYKNSLYDLHKQYPNLSALHTGDEKDVERAEIVKDFQDENGKIKIFLGSESTTKEGLTLTAASKVGMLTVPWTPGVLDQCTDRLARIGQKNAVNAYIFIYKDTIDEYVFNLIESKRSEISQVIDGEKYESDINQNIINDLVKIIKDKHKK